MSHYLTFGSNDKSMEILCAVNDNERTNDDDDGKQSNEQRKRGRESENIIFTCLSTFNFSLLGKWYLQLLSFIRFCLAYYMK